MLWLVVVGFIVAVGDICVDVGVVDLCCCCSYGGGGVGGGRGVVDVVVVDATAVDVVSCW